MIFQDLGLFQLRNRLKGVNLPGMERFENWLDIEAHSDARCFCLFDTADNLLAVAPYVAFEGFVSLNFIDSRWEKGPDLILEISRRHRARLETVAGMSDGLWFWLQLGCHGVTIVETPAISYMGEVTRHPWSAYSQWRLLNTTKPVFGIAEALE